MSDNSSGQTKFPAAIQLAAQLAVMGAGTAPAAAAAISSMPGAALSDAARHSSTAERSRDALAFNGQTVRVALSDPAASQPTAPPRHLFDKFARHVPPEHHAPPPVHHHHRHARPKKPHVTLPAYCRTDEMKPYSEDTLVRLEGPSTQLTVPNETDPHTHKPVPIGTSGVTGPIDFGKGNNDPRAIPGMLPPDVQKIEHYRNMPVNVAMTKLSEHPDFISAQSAQNAWRFVTDRLRRGAVEHFEARTGRNFHSLPTDAQLAIVSAATNLSPLWEQAPRLEKAIENLDFRQAAREERSGFIDIPGRREAEAELFDRAARCIPSHGSKPSRSR